MLYQDIQKGLVTILPFLMYLTPVVYPKPDGGAVAQIMKLNPMATILPETRYWFTGQPGEALTTFWIYSAFFALLFFFGLVIYRLAMPMIIERIGS
jgi:lipopolysaccharide transport system permease protein